MVIGAQMQLNSTSEVSKLFTQGSHVGAQENLCCLYLVDVLTVSHSFNQNINVALSYKKMFALEIRLHSILIDTFVMKYI